jgi:toxin-antitoxin system PIN domain toxin
VILLDANLLIYAHMSGMPHHARARHWLDERLNGDTGVGLPWPSLLAFVRIVSNRRLFERPERVEDAWARVGEWLGASPAWIPVPTDRHRDVLRRMMGFAGTPGLVSDAHLAALAIEHGLELASTDGDFARFPGLRWLNPLAAGG